jgi:hypothetical protein
VHVLDNFSFLILLLDCRSWNWKSISIST